MTRSTFIETYSGAFLDFLEPDPDAIHIEDIAHALAQTNRYAGHTAYPYSVAQHCVLASLVAPEGLELEALMHDAQEAYVGDMPTPLKALLPMYQEIEDRLEAVIRKKYGLPVEFNPRVKEVDRRLLATEAHALDLTLWVSIANVVPFAQLTIEPWTWQEASAKFLARFTQLTAAR